VLRVVMAVEELCQIRMLAVKVGMVVMVEAEE
jgi:hypothetical protein